MSKILIKNYCTILGIEENAGLPKIKKAYRKKAKEYHPDLNPNPNAHLQFILINEAYNYLCGLIQKEGRINDPAQNNKQDQSFYDTWVKQERARIRREAARNARMKYEEFKKTKTYKATSFLYELVDFLYIGVGLLIILVPIIYTAITGLDPKNPERSITTIIGSVLFGSLIIGMIVITKFSLVNGKVRFRKDNQS